MAEQRRPAKPDKAVKRRASPLMMLVILVLLALVGAEILHLRAEIAEAEEQQQVLQEQIDAKKQENDALTSALEKADDPGFLQELARDQLGYVRPGEKSFYDVSN